MCVCVCVCVCVGENSPIKSGAAPSLPEVLKFKIHQQIGTKYMDFGTFLLNDDTGSLVSSIEHECQHIPEQICRKILEKWIRGSGRSCTWATLIGVLRDCELNTIADQIQALKV